MQIQNQKQNYLIIIILKIKIFLRKTFTPLKCISSFSKLNIKSNSIIRSSSKSLDIFFKEYKNHKKNDYLHKKIYKLKANNLKIKRYISRQL